MELIILIFIKTFQYNKINLFPNSIHIGLELPPWLSGWQRIYLACRRLWFDLDGKISWRKESDRKAHSGILVWIISRTEEPSGQSTGATELGTTEKLK